MSGGGAIGTTLPEMGWKPCRWCGRLQPVDDFPIDPAGADGLNEVCLECHAAL